MLACIRCGLCLTSCPTYVLSLHESEGPRGRVGMARALAVANDARAFARAIQDAGYATDPSYAAKLIGLMDRYNLYRFDT